MKKRTIRRSVSLPSILDNKISLMANEYSYKSKNDLIVELLELGIIKFDEDLKLKNLICELSEDVRNLINRFND